MPFLSAKSKEREVRKVVLVFVYVRLFTHYSSTPHHRRFKMAITAGLGVVGFKSMVMGEAITAGSGTGGDGRHITAGSSTVGDESINRW